MKTTEEQILDNVTTAREVAVAALKAAKVALQAYKQSVEFADAHIPQYVPDLADAHRESQTGRDHVSDALEAVERF